MKYIWNILSMYDKTISFMKFIFSNEEQGFLLKQF